MSLIKNVEASVEDIPEVGTGVGFCVNRNYNNILFLADTGYGEVAVSVGGNGVIVRTKTASELMAEIKKYFEAVKAGHK